MKLPLLTYIRQRCRYLGMNISKLCEHAGISRQTLYALEQNPEKLPEMHTLLALAQSLQVHPTQLLQLVCRAAPTTVQHQPHSQRLDGSAFIRDVSYPDGSQVVTGQTFTKTWELQNVGATVWENRYLQCEDEQCGQYHYRGQPLRIGEGLVALSRHIAIPRTLPGELVQLSVDFVAPATPATLLSYWKAYHADGQQCFPEHTGLWVKVQVISPFAAAYHACAESKDQA